MSAIEKEHSEMVQDLKTPSSDILANLSPGMIDLWHMATGAAGEAGEVLDAVKKAAVYGKEMDIEHLVEELGDVEYYLSGVRYALGVTREQVLQANINKLRKRYPDGQFTAEQAIARADKEDAPAVVRSHIDGCQSEAFEEGHLPGGDPGALIKHIRELLEQLSEASLWSTELCYHPADPDTSVAVSDYLDRIPDIVRSWAFLVIADHISPPTEEQAG